MDTYSKGNTPHLSAPSGKKYYYGGASAFRAADISGVESEVNSCLSSLQSDMDANINNFNKTIEELADGFGEKFIKINDKALGIVDVDAFKALADQMKSTIDRDSSETESFFATCSSEINGINSWLDELAENEARYNELNSIINFLLGIFDQEGARRREAEKQEYERLPNDPMSYGDWIK